MEDKKITKELTTKDEVTDFLLYNSPGGKIRVDVSTTVEAFMGDLVPGALKKLHTDLKFEKESDNHE